jgi:hypothetical protein
VLLGSLGKAFAQGVMQGLKLPVVETDSVIVINQCA